MQVISAAAFDIAALVIFLSVMIMSSSTVWLRIGACLAAIQAMLIVVIYVPVRKTLTAVADSVAAVLVMLLKRIKLKLKSRRVFMGN